MYRPNGSFTEEGPIGARWRGPRLELPLADACCGGGPHRREAGAWGGSAGFRLARRSESKRPQDRPLTPRKIDFATVVTKLRLRSATAGRGDDGDHLQPHCGLPGRFGAIRLHAVDSERGCDNETDSGGIHPPQRLAPLGA